MPAIDPDAAAEVWIPTAELPVAHPFGLTSSPDGSTLYVTCVGDGSNGVVVAIDIATKTQSVIASGLEYVRHGIDVDSSGNVYFLDGPNPLAAGGVTLYRWDGSSISTPWGTNVFGGMFGMCIGDDDKFYLEERNTGSRSWFSRRTIGFAQDWWQPPLTSDGLFGQNRGMDTTTDYLISGDSSEGHLWIQDRATGVAVSSPAAPIGALHGIHAYADDEVYVLSQKGTVYRFNPLTGSSTNLFVTDLPVDPGIELFDVGSYADIHITSRGRCFITRGGWSADDADPSSHDEAHGVDVGIYELATTIRFGWVVGRVGHTW